MSNSPDRSTKSTRSTPLRLPLIVNIGFQVLFHSPPGVLFTFPSRYSCTIGHQGVFRLSGWSRQIHTEFQGFRPTWEPFKRDNTLHLHDYHALRSAIPDGSTSMLFYHSPATRQHDQEQPHNTPHATPAGSHTCKVWPPPLSLATTHGITIVFFSYGY